MSFPFGDFLRLGVDLANEFTEDVQSSVTHEAWIGRGDFGKPVYDDPVTLFCIIDSRQQQIVTSTGQTITVMSTLTFLDPITPNGATGRREPIDPRDRITLPDGFSGPIIDTPGSVVDSSTGQGFITEIMLGRRG